MAVSWRDLLRSAVTGPLVPEISDDDRAVLERTAHSGARKPAVRAAIVLAAAKPVPGPEIAGDLGVSQLAVLRCVRRYLNKGLTDIVNPLG